MLPAAGEGQVDPIRLVTDRESQPRGRRGWIGDRPASSNPAFSGLVNLHSDTLIGR